MSKTKVVDDPAQAMAKIGHNRIELPPDADPEGFVPEEPVADPEPQQPQPPVAAQAEPEPEPEAVPATPADSSAATMSWEDRAKLWQSNYEKLRSGAVAKDEADKLRQENEVLRQMFLRAQQSQPQQPPQQQQPPQELKQPALEDYIDDEYEPSDAFDIRTKSGKQYQKYLQDRDAYLIAATEERVVQRVTRQSAEERKRSLTQQRAAKLVDKYPQYRDPITGEPDYQRIQRELFTATPDDPDDWVKYAEFLDFKRGKAPQVADDVTNQIAKVAAMPSSVVTAPSSERKTERQIPKPLQQLADLWGEIELPPDAIIDI